MKVIYVAGPYRADGNEGMLANIVMARAYARILWKRGYAAICPHTNTAFMDGPDIPPDKFIEGDLEIIERCDAMFMLPGWEKSEGANKEYALAVNLGMPIYHSFDEAFHAQV